jgi:hypothetical protein
MPMTFLLLLQLLPACTALTLMILPIRFRNSSTKEGDTLSRVVATSWTPPSYKTARAGQRTSLLLWATETMTSCMQLW